MATESSLQTTSENYLTLNRIRDQLDALFQQAFQRSTPTLIEALPATGKSFGVVKWAADSRESLTVFAPRHDLLDEYEDWCEDFGLEHYRLPSFHRDCGSMDNGEPVDDEVAHALKRDYDRGLSALELHDEHDDLPCQRSGDCDYVTRRDVDPDTFDVLLGTYRHAYVEDWIDGRSVAFDEFPGDSFLKTFDGDLPSIVSAYLDSTDALPFRNHEDLLRHGTDEERREQVRKWRKGLSETLTDADYARESGHPHAHALAPAAVLALLDPVYFRNDWKHSRLGRGRVGVCNPHSNEWTLLMPPDLNAAECVVGLDGTPNQALWDSALNVSFELEPLLEGQNRGRYLRDVLGLRLVQTTNYWKAVQGGNGVSPPKELALLEAIDRRHERTPSLISSKRAIEQYGREGLSEIITQSEHYGDLKGSNTFATERVGVVIGNPHPGDEVIERWSALAGRSAYRREEDGMALRGDRTDYGSFGNTVFRTLVHDEVLQAAMRFGREEVGDERGATVYLHTAALPEWLPAERRIPEIDAFLTEKEGMRDVIVAIRSLEEWRSREWKATELYECASVSEKQVRNCLEKLVEYGYLEPRGKKGQGGALHYANAHLQDAGHFGEVEFPE